MQNWQKIDKDRLTLFTDAIMAIIMTLLVLDLKVPIANIETNYDLKLQLLKQLPHFYGFIISFSMIVIIWFSHQHLLKILSHADRTFTVLNFLFCGTVATLPFSTALVGEFPSYPLAVSILAFNMLIMNLFLTSMFIYIAKKKLAIPDTTPDWYQKIKLSMGFTGLILLFSAIFIASFSPSIALIMIVTVPIMHCVPVFQIFHRNPK